MRLIAFALAMMATFASFGVNHADSVKVYFSAGQRQFDPSLGENRLEMDSFITKVREAATAGHIKSVVVRGYASPEGAYSVNDRLARNRCTTIADYIADNAGIDRELIEEISGGVDWGELRRMVAENPDVPSRDKILDILDNTPIWVFDSAGKIVDSRKKRLMNLRGGQPYNWMLVNLFPLMRNAVAVTLSFKDQPESVASDIHDNEASSTVPNAQVTQSDSTDVMISPISIDETVVTDENYAADEAIGIEDDYDPRFAIKSNLLLDAILMPNLELEWLITDNWSVAVEGDVAWWKPRFNRVYRLAIISPEVRYHIRPREPWRGMYIGIFGGGGLYQLENGGNGYRGQGGMGGVSFGYMWPIGKHLLLEAGVGIGYLHAHYKVYENRDGHKVYLRTKSLDSFAPLKLKFSIAWRFDIKTKSVKTNSTL